MRHTFQKRMYGAKIATSVIRRSGKVTCRTHTFLCFVLCWHVCVWVAQADAQAQADYSTTQQEAAAKAESDREREEAASWDRIVSNNARSTPDPVHSAFERGCLAVAFALFLAWLLALRKLAARLANYLNARYDPWQKLSDVATRSFHLPELLEFFTALRNGPIATASDVTAEPGSINEPERGGQKSGSGPLDPLQDSLDSARTQIASLRNIFFELGRAPDDATRSKTLIDLTRCAESLRDSVRHPSLVPAWKMATALVGLLRQLAATNGILTPSTLRSVGTAVDLLKPLCVSGLPPELATKPPVQILVIDDDPVSRTAIRFALSKAFEKPDLAPGIKSALARLDRITYDAIFLDVEMPGMDGFELCSKIRRSKCNRETPVVFVTAHSDFQSRAKSAAAGGQELIGKPFLPFEITVKAFTLVLRNRVESLGPQPASRARLTSSPSAATTRNRSVYEEPAASHDAPLPLTAGPAQVHGLHEQLDSLRHGQDLEGRRDALLQLTAGVHELAAEAERTQLPHAVLLAGGLEAFLRKICEQPAELRGSGVDTIAAALELIPALLRPGSSARLSDSPWRFLVVDDDPVSRRATSGSLQLTFGRPENADSGSAALALAEEKEFDVIFMDVRMPGMDGFSACSKIHATSHNANTPVLFVTSHDDLQSRTDAFRAGGSGFIVKPVLSGEIRLGALTFAFRNRMCRNTMRIGVAGKAVHN